MKHQQITVDFVNMVFTAFSYLALAGAVWIFLRLVQACFLLPRHLKRQNQVQQMLQDKVGSYEKYILECEKKEMVEQETQGGDSKIDVTQTEKWKERRECLEMLKKELNRVRDGVDPHEWDYLLEEDETEQEKSSIAELQDDQASNDKHDNKVNEDPRIFKEIVESENKKEK